MSRESFNDAIMEIRAGTDKEIHVQDIWDEITTLRQRLAASEAKRDEYGRMWRDGCKDRGELTKEVEQLEQRLAESEAGSKLYRREMSRCLDLLAEVSGLKREEVGYEPAVRAIKQRLAEVGRERDKYKMEALVKFNCEVCSGALEQENANLHTQLADAQATMARLEAEKHTFKCAAEASLEKRLQAEQQVVRLTQITETDALRVVRDSRDRILQEFCNLQITYGQQKHRIRDLEQQVARSEKGLDAAYQLHTQDDTRIFTLEQQVARLTSLIYELQPDINIEHTPPQPLESERELGS